MKTGKTYSWNTRSEICDTLVYPTFMVVQKFTYLHSPSPQNIIICYPQQYTFLKMLLS